MPSVNLSSIKETLLKMKRCDNDWADAYVRDVSYLLKLLEKATRAPVPTEPATGETDKWMPIESAPRMRNILLFGVTDQNPFNWKMDSGHYSEGAKCWIWGEYEVRDGMIEPTHWMPMPPTPEGAESWPVAPRKSAR